MLQFRGAPALSNFRIERLLAALQRIEPRVSRVSVEFIHFVDTVRELGAQERRVLERLLDFDASAKPAPDGRLLLDVPRPGTVSPWSSKATDIAHVCGLDAVRRIERGKAWRIESNGPLAQAALVALASPLFDPMTEALMLEAGEAERLFETHPRGALGHVALGSDARAALSRVNESPGSRAVGWRDRLPR